MDTPPPLPPTATPGRRRGWLVAGIVTGAVLGLAAIAWPVVRAVIDSGITRGPDAFFGEQHLKTAVALIELHRVRHGRCPESLGDLEFIGPMDDLALESVEYLPNAGRTEHWVEVRRGFLGKPDIEMPAEFWRGTGYSPALRPRSARRGFGREGPGHESDR